MIILVKQDGKTQATSFIAVTVRGSTSLAVTEQKGRDRMTRKNRRRETNFQYTYNINIQ